MISAKDLKPYLQIARLDHWVKHIFILPGIFLGIALAPTLPLEKIYLNTALGIISAVLIASANYVINEWLDAEFDTFHPEKHKRPGPMGLLQKKWVYVEYVILIITGIFIAFIASQYLLVLAIVFALSGVIYNCRPFRSKDIPYIDVISESFNNPLRLGMGWAMVSNSFPPLSLLLSYWAVGAFLMSAKRLSEFYEICSKKGEKNAGLYRKSFKFYNTKSLLISCFVYALISIFGITVFIVKYRSELVITIPIFILIFSYYFHKAMNPNSIAQKPEELYRDNILICMTICLVGTIFICTLVDIPSIEYYLQNKFISLQ